MPLNRNISRKDPCASSVCAVGSSVLGVGTDADGEEPDSAPTGTPIGADSFRELDTVGKLGNVAVSMTSWIA